MGLFDSFKKNKEEDSSKKDSNIIKLTSEEFTNQFPNLSSRKFTVKLADINDVYKMPDISRFLYEHWNGWPLIHDDELSIFPKDIFFLAIQNKSEFSSNSIAFVTNLTKEEDDIWNSSPQKVDIDELKKFLDEFYSYLPKIDHSNYYFTAYDFQLNWETLGKILLKESDFTTGHTYSAKNDDENKNKARVWDDKLKDWVYIDIFDRMIYRHGDRYILIRKRYHSDNIISLYRRLQELSSYTKENNLTLNWEFHRC